jgi:signal transduction histidine kinase
MVEPPQFPGRFKTAQKGGGKTNIKFLNPVTKAVEAKTAYSEMVDDVMIGSGAYTGK